ncbi:OPT family oligopeptide transporter [Anaerosalibacter massiliensis]|uniref:Oligopeptide transporter, OPT family n=1 Tax=Anaerosalibacter massiliensis TaxID=1347392 RepID=A0A9X2S4M2_9FIRM|nr:oligopeptide transporter, OPT family [Anaerosalibacter massiliensis]MCR2043633.1 oligopeptide transporter, OPT family [Anaerosalibacter massiliensis]
MENSKRQESSRKTLSPKAYETVPGDEYEPFVSANITLPEITVTAVILGCLLSVIFGAANAYLGLKLGQTVGASVPCAVTSMAVLRGVLKRGNILENNMVQTIGSAGESVAAGVIFTIPALIVWGLDVNLLEVSVMALLGGVLGVLILIPLRKYLVSEEHGYLPFPDGLACAEVLVAGETGGQSATTLFIGAIISGIYTLCVNGFKLWKSSIGTFIKGFENAYIGIETTPALLGIGYIMGPKIAAFMFSGAMLGWLVLIPLIKYFGAGLIDVVYPATIPIAQMTVEDIWSNYIRYIGAGTVVFGGLWSFIKVIPVMFSSFKTGFQNLTNKKTTNIRTDEDMNTGVVFILTIIIFIIMAFLPPLKLGIGKSLLVLIFTTLFVPVAAKMVGMTSNNPVSGMTIATLLITSLLLKQLGVVGEEGMLAALSVGVIVCIAVGVTGDTSQDLKTGFLVGATPKNQQIGEIIGVIVSSAAIGFVIVLLDGAYGIGSPELPAPQATLMSLVVQGVFSESLPWILIFTGMAIGAIVEMMGLPVLPFAIGLYLPISLSSAPVIGGLIRWILEKRTSGEEFVIRRQTGTLVASGFVAGDSLMGVVLAIFAYFNINIGFGANVKILENPIFTIIPYILICLVLHYFSNIKKPKNLDA